MSEKFERALLLTGMMNEKFVEMIKGGEVDEAYIAEAFKNFREAQNNAVPKVEVQYVLGIMFSEDEERVLAIWKNRPDWQAGKLNGIGGKIEDGETPIEAMRREFREETGFIGKFKTQAQIDELLVDGKLVDQFDAAEKQIIPQWRFIGTRGRPALYDNQPNSYRMHIFACHYDTKACDVRSAPEFIDVGLDEGCFIEYETRADESETIINLQLNLEMLKQSGVPGFAWVVDIAMSALRENFLIDVIDPADMDYLDDTFGGTD